MRDSEGRLQHVLHDDGEVLDVGERVTHLAGVPSAVPVGVDLAGVVELRAVVERTGVPREAGISEPVRVGVGARIARVAAPIPVCVLLARVRHVGTVVDGIDPTVAVAVVAGVADAVAVPVRLSRMGDGRTVVAAVRDAVVVGIHPIVVPGTDVAGVAVAVAVRVRLRRIRRGRAVVRNVDDAVAVDVLAGTLWRPWRRRR